MSLYCKVQKSRAARYIKRGVKERKKIGCFLGLRSISTPRDRKGNYDRLL